MTTPAVVLPPCARPGNPGDWWTTQHAGCTGSVHIDAATEVRCECPCHQSATVAIENRDAAIEQAIKGLCTDGVNESVKIAWHGDLGFGVRSFQRVDMTWDPDLLAALRLHAKGNERLRRKEPR